MDVGLTTISRPFDRCHSLLSPGLTYALVSVFFFVPVLLFIWKGEQWRHMLGTPNFNRGI